MVHFDQGLLMAYDILMLYFYEVALSWAYQPNDNPLPKQDIEHVLAHHKTLNMESFLGHFYLWSYICRKLILPIPQMEQIIPFVLSQWNAIKGGSDTITKLLCLNMYDPPYNVPRGHAIARMIFLRHVIFIGWALFLLGIWAETLYHGTSSVFSVRYASICTVLKPTSFMVQNRKTEPAVLGFLGTASGQRQSEISRTLCLPLAQRPDAHGAGQCREISGILITNRSLLFSIAVLHKT